MRNIFNFLNRVTITLLFMFALVICKAMNPVSAFTLGIDAGDFTKSDLVETLLKIDRIWDDPIANADYKANVDVVKAIKSEQTASVTVLETDEKDRDVKVTWINACDDTTAADTNDCNVGGAELHSDSQTLALDITRTAGFNVKEKMWRTNNHDFTEAVAKGLLRKMKALEEYFATVLVGRIESYKGVNELTNGKGTVDGTETYVAPSDWNANLFAYFQRVGIINKFSNSFLLSGNNLYEANLNALLANSNADGKGDAAKFQLIRKYFDLFNIDTVNDPDLKTYLINRGAIAMAFKNYYGGTPIEYNGAGLSRYSIPSKNIEGLRFDVTYTNSCANNEITHKWSLHMKAGIFLNPTGCVETRTGVLSFINALAPEA